MIAAWLLASSLAAAPAAAPAQAFDAEAAKTIRAVIDERRHPWLDRAPTAAESDQLSSLYAPRAYAPLWSEAGRPRPQTGDALALLAGAAAHGLRPDAYASVRLQDGWTSAADGGAPPSDAALLDVATSLCVLRYLSDLHVGRVDPRETEVGFDRPEHAHAVAPLLSEAIATGKISELPARLEPGWPQYRGLLRALGRYRELAAGPPLPEVSLSRTVHPGDTFDGATALAARLAMLGDLAPGKEPAAGDTRYTGALVEAVESFQERHGLAVDGVLGKGTVAALGVAPAERVRQIELALERLRWIPDIAPGPVVVVNVPAFRLWAIDTREDPGRARLTMPVIVGKAVRTQTPIFFGTMKYLVFQPYWNVPSSIQLKEIVPALRRNPGYLEANDMEIVRDFAAPAGDAVPVDDAAIAALAAGRYAVRQRPGAHNSLGRVKFIFPNSESVYLHDTPAQSLFERTRRDFSHGCVRVGDPERLAEFVLDATPGWTRERIAAAMTGTPNVTVRLARPVPVLIFYTTAYAAPDGRAYFTDDLYGLDGTLEATLGRKDSGALERR